MKHINAFGCPKCDDILKSVHPDLARWVNIVRSTCMDAHVSCGHRGQIDQEDAFRRGVSNAHYGQSAHNVLPSYAVDLFRLTQQGGANFDSTWYQSRLAPIARASGVTWGGDWRFVDMPHFELKGFIKFKP